MSVAHRKFLEWLESKGWSQSEAARQLGCHQTMVNKLCSGKRVPGRALAAQIELMTKRWSGGAIRAADWDARAAAATGTK